MDNHVRAQFVLNNVDTTIQTKDENTEKISDVVFVQAIGLIVYK